MMKWTVKYTITCDAEGCSSTHEWIGGQFPEEENNPFGWIINLDTGKDSCPDHKGKNDV